MAKSQQEINQVLSILSQQLTDTIQAELDREQNIQFPNNIPRILSLANELINNLEELEVVTEQNTLVGEVNSENNIDTPL